MGGGLADVGNDGDTIHGLLIVTDLQNLKVDLDVGVPHTSSNAHPHSDLHTHLHTVDIPVSSLTP